MSKLKLLYFSCHETLERDELTIFNKLGFDVFPIGHYTHPDTPIKSSRGSLPFSINPEFVEMFDRYHSYQEIVNNLSKMKCGEIAQYAFKINREFADIFDIVYIGRYAENLTINWSAIQKKKIIFRTISHFLTHVSQYLKYVKIVFLSENEKYLYGYKPDAVIRQPIDTDFYSGWTGGSSQVLTVNKWFKKRGDVSCYKEYEKITTGFNRLVCGFDNEDIPWAISGLSQEEIQKRRQSCGVYYSTCTKPGCVTYSFIEALSTGCPIVSVGPKLGSLSSKQLTFDIDKFIENGENGFYSDNVEELRNFLKQILLDKKLAEKISKNGREAAIKFFSEEKCLNDWKNFFKEHIL